MITRFLDKNIIILQRLKYFSGISAWGQSTQIM